MDKTEFILKSREILQQKKELILTIKVKPNSAKNEFSDLLATDPPTLKVKIQAVPEKNKANTVLQKFVKKEFQATAVEILAGGTSALKKLKLTI